MSTGIQAAPVATHAGGATHSLLLVSSVPALPVAASPPFASSLRPLWEGREASRGGRSKARPRLLRVSGHCVPWVITHVILCVVFG